MKSFLKWLAAAGPSVALVIPLVPVLYALVGGGVVGTVACMVLGAVTYWAVSHVLASSVEFYRWTKRQKGGTL
jgi:hypothetical protein